MYEINQVYYNDFIPDWHNLSERISLNILVFVSEGSVQYKLNEQYLTLNKGEVLIIPKGSMREAKNANGLHQKYAITFNISTLTTLPFLQSDSFQIIKMIYYEQIKQRFEVLYHEWLSKLPYYQELCNSMLGEILSVCNRDLHFEGFAPHKKVLVQKLQAFILKHYRESFTLNDLACHIQQSKSYTIRIFKQVSGLTPFEYLHMVRVTKAKEFLIYTDMSISEIADYLGYCDQAYFNRVYKKIEGMPPSTARKYELKQ
jgi:YesN/AraC family two-component response regulator